MEIDKTKVEWVEIDGSIFTKATKRLKLSDGRSINVPLSIAFNVGLVAKHIVLLHNASLSPGRSLEQFQSSRC